MDIRVLVAKALESLPEDRDYSLEDDLPNSYAFPTGERALHTLDDGACACGPIVIPLDYNRVVQVWVKIMVHRPMSGV